MNRPLPEVAFSGEQELLVAPEDLSTRKKRSESGVLPLAINNYGNSSQYWQVFEKVWRHVQMRQITPNTSPTPNFELGVYCFE